MTFSLNWFRCKADLTFVLQARGRLPGSARLQVLALGRLRNGPADLLDDRFLHIAELVLAEEHLISNEESR